MNSGIGRQGLNTSTELAETKATPRNAQGKSARVICAVPWMACDNSSEKRADGDAKAQRQLLRHRGKARRPAHHGLSMSA